jgi:phosphoadenosine phosphosulfate reductase
MLVENTLFGVRDKVQIAIDRIKQFEPEDGYYVAFSGGKDSCVVLDIVKRAGVKFDAHYNLTTVDPPELIYFIRENHSEVEKHLPKLTMWQLIPKKKIPPTRIMRYCCAVLKEGGGHGRFVITGVRWAESAKRAKRRMTETCMTDNSKRFLHPIIDWSDEEVWQYIRENKLPYCSLYDEGQKRIGCVMCPMGNTKGMEEDARRWPKIAAMYKWACNKTYERLVEENPDKERTWKSGDDMYSWWITNKASEKDNGMVDIFEDGRVDYE